MVALVKLFGIVIVGFGVAFFVRTELLKKWGEFWLKNTNYLYLGGVINVLLGLIFLFAASGCQVPWLVILMGILALAKGVFILAWGPKKFTPIIKWGLRAKEATKRLAAIATLVLGVLLVYSA